MEGPRRYIFSSLAHSAKDIEDVTSAMNTELENLKVWLLIGARHIINGKITAEPLKADFEISEEPMEQKPSVKYLRVHIENRLQWKDTIKAALLVSS